MQMQAAHQLVSLKRYWLTSYHGSYSFLNASVFANKLNKIFFLLSMTAGELSNKIGPYQAAEVCRRSRTCCLKSLLVSQNFKIGFCSVGVIISTLRNW